MDSTEEDLELDINDKKEINNSFIQLPKNVIVKILSLCRARGKNFIFLLDTNIVKMLEEWQGHAKRYQN